MFQPVQRTLLLTCGPTAQEMGQMLQTLLISRRGPVSAVAWLALPDLPPPDLPLAEAQTCLHRLAQKSVVAELAAAGWQLDRLPDVAVYLVLDAAAPLDTLAFTWLAELAHLTRQYLGCELAPALIWLVPEPWAAAACLIASETQLPVCPRGVYVLGLLNADGFRLPDASALAQISAEFLYALIATPLRDAPEWLEASVAAPGLIISGIAQWAWEAEPLFQQTVTVWMIEVLNQWLLQASSGTGLLQPPSAWFDQQGLSWDRLSPHLLSSEQQRLPDFHPEYWSAPWPWDIRFWLAEQKRWAEQDQITLAEQQEAIMLQADLSLQDDELALRATLEQFLDEHPVGGLHQVWDWLQIFLTMLAEELEQMVLRLEDQTRHEEFLTHERTRLEDQVIKSGANWPDGEAVTWIRRTWRPWQWPQLAWHYHRLRLLGRQLSDVWQQQTESQRQRLRLNVGLHLYRQFEQIVKRTMSQVEEMGEMLRSLLSHQLPVTNESLSTSQDPLPGSTSQPPLLSPHLLSPSPMNEEATLAAQAVGGLGQQLTKLDDAIEVVLRQQAIERLNDLRQSNAMAGLHLHYPDQSSLMAWWLTFWQEASPLWRPDEARLPEVNRQGQTELAFLVGHGSYQLQSWLRDTAQVVNLHWFDTSDPRTIWLLRLQGGLNAAALLPRSLFNDEEE